MRRVFGCGLLFSCLVLVAIGCKTEAPKDPEKGNLVLVLPESAPAPDHAKTHVSKLTVDGEDFSEPRGTKRTLQVVHPKGKDEVKVEFSFWPNTYTNIIRTKIVKLERDKSVEADLTKEDAATPDLIKPIYVPTSEEVVEQMCKMANIGPDDVVMDIGCGEGLMVLQAVKNHGAKKGIGIDIEEGLVKKARANAKSQGLDDKVEFRAANALEIKDFSEATVVLLYLGDFLNQKLKPTLRATLKPGTRVVSHRFEMGGDWPADVRQAIVTKHKESSESGYDLLLWRIK
jgi:precorrin-6B methylase 2